MPGSSGDSGYTQALLLHQRARMERLVKELEAAGQRLQELKSAVSSMEHEALRRRFRRDTSTDLPPTPEDLSRLRALNRKLQVDLDCALKEVDLLESRASRAARREEEQRPRTSISEEESEGAQWTCHICTFLNHPALFRCEECDMLRRHS